MHRLPHDPDTEARIRDQVIADAMGDKQVTQAWARYLQDYVSFPFTAFVIGDRLHAGTSLSRVEVVGFHPDVPPTAHQVWLWGHQPREEFYFTFRPDDFRQVGEGDQMDEETKQALRDWCYWVQHMT